MYGKFQFLGQPLTLEDKAVKMDGSHTPFPCLCIGA